MKSSHSPIITFVLFVLLLWPVSLGAGAAVGGSVSHRISGCDYFLVQTRNGYDLLEWFDGHDPDKGDSIVGKYEEYGFHDVLDDTAGETVRIYTEDFWLSKSDALEQLTENCE